MDQGLYEFSHGGSYIVIIRKDDPVQLTKKKLTNIDMKEKKIDIKEIFKHQVRLCT